MSIHHLLARIHQLELYFGIYKKQLRWFTSDGKVIPLPEVQEKQSADRLEAILRSQGIDITQFPI